MPEHIRRSPARFLAPLALIGFLFAFFVVVTSSAVDGGGDDRRTDRAETRDRSAGGAGGEDRRGATTSTTTTTSRPRGRRTYTIKTGDTLGAISEQTGVPLERLQELNPDLDPQAMVAGQRIKLRE